MMHAGLVQAGCCQTLTKEVQSPWSFLVHTMA